MKQHSTHLMLAAAGLTLCGQALPLAAQTVDPEAVAELVSELEQIEAQRDAINQRRIAEDERMDAEIRRIRERLDALAPHSVDTVSASEAPAAALVIDTDAELEAAAFFKTLDLKDDVATTLSPTFSEVPVSTFRRSTAVLSSSTTSSRAAIKFEVSSSDLSEKPPDLGNQGIIWLNSFALTASAPLAEGAERTQLYSLNGPESGFTLGTTMNFRQYRYRRDSQALIATVQAQTEELAAPVLDLAYQACQNGAVFGKRTFGQCQQEQAHRGTRLFVMNFLGNESNRPGGMVLTSEQENALRLLTMSRQPIRLDYPILNFGLNGSVSHKEFTYFDAATATVLKDQARTGFELGFSGSLIYPVENKGYSLSAGASFQRNYKEASNRAVCSTVTPTGSFFDCPLRKFGAPTRDDSLLLRGEWRYQISDDVAISPVVVFDALDDEFRAELPIYLIADTKSNLTGGIRIGYDSEQEEELILGLFVAAPFGL